jgi:RNA polymerase sigma-70 factor (ECF subfamily)
MSRESDAGLAERLVAGDPSAFRDLVEAYKRKVYGLAYEMTQNHTDAEDISQISFMKVHKSVGTIDPSLGLNTWLYRIVYRTALDHIRKRTFFPKNVLPSLVPLSCDPPDSSQSPESAAEVASLRRRVDEALAKISRRERAALILRHYHGLKIKEIAQTLGVSLGSAKSYLFRALRKLQKELAKTEICLGRGDR